MPLMRSRNVPGHFRVFYPIDLLTEKKSVLLPARHASGLKKSARVLDGRDQGLDLPRLVTIVSHTRKSPCSAGLRIIINAL